MKKLSLLVFAFVFINVVCAGTAFAVTQNTTNISNITPQTTNTTQTSSNITPQTTNPTQTSIVNNQTNATFPSIHGYFINPDNIAVNTINPTTLKTQGITDIFVLTNREDPNDTLAPFVTKFAGTGINVYAWVVSFKNFNGNWFNPEDNATLENQIINNITSIAANYNVNGVMLDYLRYPGTAYKYPNATAEVDSFAAAIRNNINIINNKNIPGKPKILLSATLMPEGAVNNYYYGQDYNLLSHYLDFLSPMIYVGNYYKTTSWIGTTTQYIKAQANGKPVVAILQTYNSDANPTPLTASQLNLDIGTALNNGSYGYELFRYGLVASDFTGYNVTSPPTVKTIDPTNNAVNIPTNKMIKITFSEPIKAGTMWIEVKNSSGTLTPITTSISGNVLSITPNSLLVFGTNYTVILHSNSITDLAGNGLTPPYTTKFTTTTQPTASASPIGGLYNSTKTVTLNMSRPGTIYYTLNGSNPTTSSSKYITPITITSTTVLKYLAVDTAGNKSPIYSQTYTIDKVPPTASANPLGGFYNSTKSVTLNMSERGTIYYTLNGSTPTTASSKYITPITITSTTVLKYLAVDTAGNKSPIYSQTYTIDKVPPKVSSTSPVNNASGVSLTSSITIKFSENIIVGTNYSKIYVKNLNTGTICAITINISGNTLTIKQTKSRLYNDTYEVYIPSAAVKDKAGNNLLATYTFKFKTV